jgi:hypothetical protein
LPNTKQVNKQVVGESLEKDLREEVKVGDKCCLQDDDWNVGSVEKLDWVVSLLPLYFEFLTGSSTLKPWK